MLEIGKAIWLEACYSTWMKTGWKQPRKWMIENPAVWGLWIGLRRLRKNA